MKATEDLQWHLKTFGELTTSELYSILALRSAVFVVEQQCAYQDLDDKDQEAVHLLALRDGKLLAYARLLPPGLAYETAGIGRIITHSAVRGTGLGRQLVARALHETQRRYGKEAVTISAQAHLSRFYGEFGFVQTGERYLEDNIPHVRMISLGLPAGISV